MSCFLPTNVEVQVKECPICFEQIGDKNTCTTECGHTFCFKCMASSIQRNVNCPCCRFELIERTSDEDEDEEEDYEESVTDDNDDEEEEEEEDDSEAKLEYIVSVFEKRGYSLHDAMSLLCGRLSNCENKNTSEYYEKLSEDFDEILYQCDTDAAREFEERETMGQEDIKC